MTDWEKDHDEDMKQYKKRIAGMAIFDQFLNACQDGKCPKLPRDLKNVYLLSDISLDGYVHEKADLFLQEESGLDEGTREGTARKRIQKVLNCKVTPSLDTFLLDYDSAEVVDKFSRQARRRKAFWMFKRHEPNNHPHTDYCGACSFIEQLHGMSILPQCERRHIDKARRLLENHYHIANALDLFRLCQIRRKTMAFK